MTEMADRGDTLLNNAKHELLVLPLLLAVMNEFDSQEVSYCYWKSSKRIHRALSGEGDLDLLIAR